MTQEHEQGLWDEWKRTPGEENVDYISRLLDSLQAQSQEVERLRAIGAGVIGRIQSISDARGVDWQQALKIYDKYGIHWQDKLTALDEALQAPIAE